jgi:hypothetical protein
MKAVIFYDPTIGYICGQSSLFTLVDPPTPSKPTADTFQLVFRCPRGMESTSIFLARFGVHSLARLSLRDG